MTDPNAPGALPTYPPDSAPRAIWPNLRRPPAPPAQAAGAATVPTAQPSPRTAAPNPDPIPDPTPDAIIRRVLAERFSADLSDYGAAAVCRALADALSYQSATDHDSPVPVRESLTQTAASLHTWAGIIARQERRA